MRMLHSRIFTGQLIVTGVALATAMLTSAPVAYADNQRLNRGVIASVQTVQGQNGCTNVVTDNPMLRLAAQWHAVDVLNNRSLDGGFGSDGSSPQQRAQAAGFRGHVDQTVAINPALAISGIEIMQRWYYDPAALEVMKNCDHDSIGVWSENSLDRSVVVAVYGKRAADG